MSDPTNSQEFILTGGYHSGDPTSRWVATQPGMPEEVRDRIIAAAQAADCALGGVIVLPCQAPNEYRTNFDFQGVDPKLPVRTLLSQVASFLMDAGHSAVREVTLGDSVVKEPL